MPTAALQCLMRREPCCGRSRHASVFSGEAAHYTLPYVACNHQQAVSPRIPLVRFATRAVHRGHGTTRAVMATRNTGKGAAGTGIDLPLPREDTPRAQHRERRCVHRPCLQRQHLCPGAVHHRGQRLGRKPLLFATTGSSCLVRGAAVWCTSPCPWIYGLLPAAVAAVPLRRRMRTVGPPACVAGDRPQGTRESPPSTESPVPCTMAPTTPRSKT